MACRLFRCAIRETRQRAVDQASVALESLFRAARNTPDRCRTHL